MNKSFLLAVLLVTAVSSAHAEVNLDIQCPIDQAPAPSYHALRPSDLAGDATTPVPTWLPGTWRLVSHEDTNGKTKSFRDDDRPVLLTLTAASTIKVVGGCNAKAGAFTFQDDQILLTNLSSTLMACQPESLMEVDDLLRDVLSADPTPKRKGKRLTLTTPKGEALHFVQHP